MVFASKLEDEQPSPTKRQSHRLSKPPTNRSSSNLLSIVAHEPNKSVDNSPISPLCGFDAVNTSMTGECRSRQDARQKVRSHLFSESSESPPRVPEEDDKANISRRGSLIGNMKDRLSRSGSFVSQLASSKGSTTNLPGTLNESRLSLVAESILADTDASRQWILNKIESDEWTAKNYVTSPVHEASSERFAPIRRRSLLTPGIATRIPSDILRKPPPPDSFITQADRDYYFDPRYPENSPLSQLEALDLAEEEWTMPAVRNETPCELDYSHLGGLRHGTLRITNGAASPTPSETTSYGLTRRSSTPELGNDDEFFSLSGNWKRGEDDRGRSAVRDGDDNIVPNRLLRLEISHYCLASQTLRAQRSGSFLRYEQCNGPDISPDADMDDLEYYTPQRLTRTASPPGLVMSSPNRTSVMAEEYMSELPMSPFSFERSPSIGRSPSPRLHSTSKATEFDDALFDDEAVFTSPTDDQERLRLESAYASSTSGQEHIAGQHGRSRQRLSTSKTLSKADSGYSSNASLRSFKSDRQIRKQEAEQRLSGEPIIESISLHPDHKHINITPLSVPDTTSAALRNPLIIDDNNKPLISRSPILVKSQTTKSHPLTTLNLFQQSTDTIVTLDSTNSAPVADMKLPKKLRKKRTVSQPPPAKSITVQGYREMAQTHVPPVPSDVASRLAVRSSQLPELDRTFQSSHHTSPGASLSDTSLSPGVIRFPAPGNHEDSSNKTSDLLFESAASVMNVPEPACHRDHASVKPIRSMRNSSQQRDLAAQRALPTAYAAIRDFGTVTESIGRGPYDAARSTTVPKLPRGADNSHLSHPHNISSARRRAKSITGMEAEEAVKLARRKSKTLAEGKELSSWQEKQKLFNDRGGIPGKNVRAKSVMSAAPPMPSLPSPQQVSEIEKRRVSAERPSLAPPGNHRARSAVSATRAPMKPLKESSVSMEPPNTSTAVKRAPIFDQQAAPPMEASNTISAVSWPVHASTPAVFERKPCVPDRANPIEFHKNWKPQREGWRARRRSAHTGFYRRQSPGEEERAQFFQENPARAPELPMIEPLREPTLPNIEPRVDVTAYFPQIGRGHGGMSYGYKHVVGSSGSIDTGSLCEVEAAVGKH